MVFSAQKKDTYSKPQRKKEGKKNLRAQFPKKNH